MSEMAIRGDSQYYIGNITNIMNEPIGNAIKRYFNNTDEPLFIIVPFISNSTLLNLLSGVGDTKVTVVTSWRKDHLINGVSSISLFDLCQDNDWTLYINSELHAKIYSKSFNSCYLGSANCTNKALFDTHGNIECMTFIDQLTVGNRIELNKIISNSTLVTKEVYDAYKAWLNDCECENDDLTEPLIDDSFLYQTYQLPAICNPFVLWYYLCDPQHYKEYASEAEHDLAIYLDRWDYETEGEFISNLRVGFINHPFIKEIDKYISYEGVRFGYLKQVIQNNCTDVPVPHRSNITTMVQNIYRWFEELFPECYYVDVPGKRSEVIHKYIPHL